MDIHTVKFDDHGLAVVSAEAAAAVTPAETTAAPANGAGEPVDALPSSAAK